MKMFPLVSWLNSICNLMLWSFGFCFCNLMVCHLVVQKSDAVIGAAIIQGNNKMSWHLKFNTFSHTHTHMRVCMCVQCAKGANNTDNRETKMNNSYQVRVAHLNLIMKIIKIWDELAKIRFLAAPCVVAVRRTCVFSHSLCSFIHRFSKLISSLLLLLILFARKCNAYIVKSICVSDHVN